MTDDVDPADGRFEQHASPPPGTWMNDPNGLVFADGQWRLFVQASTDGPGFASRSWARLSSPDLLTWTWDGVVITPDALGQAYSGCVVATPEGLTAYFTRAGADAQRQVQMVSTDAGATWTAQQKLGPEGRNQRDPFVFFCLATGDWRMLLAEPCAWTDRAPGETSKLSVWRRDGQGWHFVSWIGPWMAPGVLWEVPVLIDFGAAQVLIISIVDRYAGRADCAVRYWVGTFDGTQFQTDTPADGLPLDCGPDFYAAIVDTQPGRDLAGAEPQFTRQLVAWASNWAIARSVSWPGNASGGPITMPRQLSFDASTRRLVQRPITGRKPAREYQWDRAERLIIKFVRQGGCRLMLTLFGNLLYLRRDARNSLLAAEITHFDVIADAGPQTVRVFNDCGLLEIFIEPAGVSFTVFMAGNS